MFTAAYGRYAPFREIRGALTSIFLLRRLDIGFFLRFHQT